MLKKIVKNRLGFAGLIFISLLLVIAVLGYIITPDATPKANDIHLEVAIEKPGFQVDMLRGAKREVDDVSWFTRLMSGQENAHEYIPVAKWKADSYVVYNKNGLEMWQPSKTIISEKDIIHRTFILGTDRYGRYVLSRVIIGKRVSRLVGFMAVLSTL